MSACSSVAYARLKPSHANASAVVVASLALLLHATPAHAGAGIGEVCDVDIPVAHGFHWNQSLGDLISVSAGVSAPGVREVAWDESYVFAKTGEGSWYIIDTRKRGAAAVESFSPASTRWKQRLDEIGRPTLRWQEVSMLPQPWWSIPRCTVIVLWILTAALWPYSLVAFVLPILAILGLDMQRARRRRLRRVAS